MRIIIFHFSSLITSVIKRSAINPVKLLSRKNVGRIAQICFKVKLRALWYSLQVTIMELFLRNSFLHIFRATVPLTKYFEKTLKDYTAKLLNQRLGNSNILMCSTEWMFWEKSKKDKGKCPCWIPASVTLPYDFIRTRLLRH